MKKTVTVLSLVLSLLMVFSACSVNTANAPSELYADANNWAYNGIGENKDCDLFLICPTVYGGENNEYNMSLEDTETKESFLGALNMERGIYEDTCRMYAPYYRQAGLSVYTMSEEEREPYLETAYEDVRDAFLYYMENENDGRPYIIAGFSQGSDMALRLMKEFLDEEEYSESFICAYMIGWPITQEDIDECPYLKPAQGESDTGVIISFNSESVDTQTSVIVPDKTLAINPLNWKTDSTPATKEENLGACFTDYSGAIVNEIPNLTGCYIDPERGTLKVTDVTPQEYPAALDIFEDGVYHIYDYQFFYRNLQENVKVRVDAYLNK